MSSIDERVVQMKFNNSQFEAGVKQTQGSLDALKKGLNLDASKKSLEGLNEAGKHFSLAGIADGVQGIASKFSAMSIIGITALASIANKAVSVGISMVKSMTIDPIKSGLQEYETNLNAIQTILANTSSKGTNLKQVNAALAELNTYSDKTIYNFSEMAKNIGTFTAAGVDLKTSTAAIKGIANLAAVSGSNSQQASTAMYQLSQALSTGKVSLMDWNSVVNAGMGGQVFQDAIKETARNQGIAVDSIIKKNGSFRDSLQDGWLTSKVLTETLSKFTGDLNAQQLKTMGYNDKQIVGIMKMAKTAQDAATKVKTMSQLIGTLQEAAGSGWTQTWQYIFGDFEEAKTLFTGVNNVLGGMIQSSSDARNKIVGDWKKLGGRTAAIDAVKNSFEAVMAVLKPIQQAFGDIFPPMTGKKLADITKAIRDFTAKLKIGAETSDQIRRAFRGLFSILDIGMMVIKGVLGMIGKLIMSSSKGSSSIMDIAARVGNWLTMLDLAIHKGDGFTKFFEILGNVIQQPIKWLQQLVKWIQNFVDGIDKTDFSGVNDGVKNLGDGLKNAADKLSPFARLGEMIAQAWGKVGGLLKGIATIFAPMAMAVGNWFKQFGSTLVESMKTMDFKPILDLVNTGLFGALIILIRKFLKGGVKIDVGGGFLGKLKDIFGGLTDTMDAMQKKLKADTLIRIAAAIAILTVSVVALSMIDPAKLAAALGAMTIMFGQLFGSMAIFDKLTASKGFTKMPLVTGAMILLAIAVDLLAIAVAKLAKLNWNELAKGLTGVLVLMGGMAAVAPLLSKSGPGLIRTGAGLIVVAVAIKILASAVADFAKMDWQTMLRGLAGVGAALVGLSLFTRIVKVNKGAMTQATGLILLGAALKIIASVVKDFSGMNWDQLAKGFAGMGASLLILAGAMRIMPKDMVLKAAALVIVGAALKLIGDAVKNMGGMSWDEIAKGLTVLAASIVVISAALFLTEGTIMGSLALIVAAKAMSMLVPVLKSMGGMSWEEIAKGLVMLAASLLVIGASMFLFEGAALGAVALIVVAGALAIMQPVLKSYGDMSWEAIAKGLVMLAGSLVIMGASLYLFEGAALGAAALIVVAGALAILSPVLQVLGGMSWDSIIRGLTMLAGTLAILGIAGAVLTPVVPTLIGLAGAVALLGVGMALAGVGMLAFSAGLTALSIAGVAGTAALVTVVTGLLGLLPMAATQLGLAIVAFAQVLGDNVPVFIAAMVKLIMGLLQAINTTAPAVVATLLGLIGMLLNQLAINVPKFVQSGATLVIGILNGIARNIGGLVTAGTNIIVNFLNGIANNIGRVITAGANLIVKTLEGIGNNISKVTNAGADLVIKFVNSVADTVRTRSGELNAAGGNLATAIVDGMTGGLASKAAGVAQGAWNMAKDALHAIQSAIDSNSPSKETYKLGGYFGDGFILGIVGMSKASAQAAGKMGTGAVQAIKSSIVDMANAASANIDSSPTIRPVLDLSAIRRDSGLIGGMLSSTPLAVNATYDKATVVASSARANEKVSPATAVAEESMAPGVTFIQNNNSPKALSRTEIYRDTKNQLSKIKKGALV